MNVLWVLRLLATVICSAAASTTIAAEALRQAIVQGPPARDETARDLHERWETLHEHGEEAMNGTDRELILRVAAQYAATGTDADVVRAAGRVAVRAGDLERALEDLMPMEAQFGPRALLERLKNEACTALLGEKDLVPRLEDLRKQVIGNAVGQVATATALLSGLTGWQTPVAVIVFLYMVPVGVRAICAAPQQT